MLKAFIFMIKYNIIKEPENLSLHTEDFFKLNNKIQMYILDKYFNYLDKNFNIDYYFNNKQSFYYKNGREISFFNNYYFDLKILDHNIYNLKLIDKFNISEKKINKIILSAISILKENKNININYLLSHSDELPKRLSNNIEFMSYLVNIDYHNIKYMSYSETSPETSKKIIDMALKKTSKDKDNIKLFLNSKGKLSKLLSHNLNFILYIIENDINNIKYLDESILNTLPISSKDKLINFILKNNIPINILSKNHTLFNYLNKDYNFIINLINSNIDNIKYIDWYNIPSDKITKIINYIVLLSEKNNYNIEINNYSFKNIFYTNYNFIKYLVTKNPYNIKYAHINDSKLNDKLINIFLKKIKNYSHKFNIKYIIDDNNYINSNLIENPEMLKFLFYHKHDIVKYINFFNLNNPKIVVDYLVKEIYNKDYIFNNNDFLINNKYPIHLSNNYLFMKYVIDINFNNLSYIDISMLNNNDLKKIINYAFKMVYYVRGNNMKLNFDINGYFKNTDIYNNAYFQKCLKSL